MRVIVWGINYAPEKTGIAPYNTGLCEHLAARGHEIEMVTTFPYYPQWSKRREDRGRLYRTEVLRTVRVRRCWHYVPARPTALKRMIHEATFVATSFLRVVTLRRADAVVVISPPLLLGCAAWLLRKIKRLPCLIHVQDMQPDAALALGMLKPGRLARVLYAMERFAYRHAACVSGITAGMLDLFAKKGVPPERRIYLPNWASKIGPIQAEATAGDFRRRHAIPDAAFLAVYSGNLGKKQGLDIILDTAGMLRSATGDPAASRVRFLIAGDGVEKPALASRVERENLANVTLLDLQPDAEYLLMLKAANVCLVTQQPGSGALFFPSKLLSILSQGRPVIASADPGGELERALLEGRFGWHVAPGDAQGLARIITIAAGAPAEADNRGKNGRDWVAKFDRERVLAEWERVLLSRFSANDG